MENFKNDVIAELTLLKELGEVKAKVLKAAKRGDFDDVITENFHGPFSVTDCCEVIVAVANCRV